MPSVPRIGSSARRFEVAFRVSRDRLERFRRNTVASIKSYVGQNYLDDGSDWPVPVNMLELAINTYKRMLAPSNPAVLVTTDVRDLVPQAEDFEAIMNHQLREMKFGEALDDAVMQALFGMAVVKAGVTSSSEEGLHGFEHDAGTLFADVVDPDDWVHDMTVKRWEQVQFMGNRYQIDYERAMDTVFKGQDLKPSDPGRHNQSGDERVGVVTGQGGGSFGSSTKERFRDVLELWDIFLPGSNEIVTYQADDSGGIDIRKGEELTRRPWRGPQNGPYYMLGYNKVPSSTVPLPPAAIMRDMHDLGNLLYNKLGDQASRQKTIGLYREGAEDNANEIRAAGDGDMVATEDPSNIGEMKFGGPAPENVAFWLTNQEAFNRQAGNLDALAGLGPQSDTLGQDRLVAFSASQRIADWSDRTINFAHRIVSDLGDYIWSNPLKEFNLTRDIGSGVKIPVRFSKDLQEGDFKDFTISMNVFSMRNRTPEERLQTILQTVTQVIAPLMPALEAQGKELDMEHLVSTIADYTDTPEIARIVRDATRQPLAEQGLGRDTEGRVRQSPVTTRQQVRNNTSGSSRQGKAQDTIQSLLRSAQ